MAGFAESLRAQVDNILSQVDSRCYSIAYELFITTIQNTPHTTKWSRGNLINDWHCAANSYSSALFSPPDINGNSTVNGNTDPTGSGSISRVTDFKDAKTFLGKDGFLSLTNNQPYAYRVEYLGFPEEDSAGGWHWTGRVGPYAMVRNSLTLVSAKYR